MSQSPLTAGAILIAGLLPLIPMQNGARGNAKASRAVPEFREAVTPAIGGGAERIHAWRGGDVPDRARVFRAAAATEAGAEQLRAAIGRDGNLDAFLADRDDGFRGNGPRGNGGDARFARDPWHDGLLVDAWAPEAFGLGGRTALALRMRTVLVTGDFSLRDMATRHVVRIRALDPDPLLKLTLDVPAARRDRVDPYLVTIGIATDDRMQEGPPFRVLVDTVEVPFSVSPDGIHVVVGLGPGCHTVMVRALPFACDDVFEFRYAMVNRL